MADPKRFRTLVGRCRKPYTQAELEKAINLPAGELSHRLGGTGRQPLTRQDVLNIVITLARWQCVRWEEAVELLETMDYPLDTFEWKTKLQEHIVSPDLPPTPEGMLSAVVLERDQLLHPRRRIFQAPDLPKEYVPRSNVFNEIKHLLLNQKGHQATVLTTALRGAGGFGKTTLASALCHDPDIQATFPDGILWVELGEHPPRPLDVLNGILQALEPSLSGALTLEEALKRWRKALEKRAYLLVIDDVWQTEAL